MNFKKEKKQNQRLTKGQKMDIFESSCKANL